MKNETMYLHICTMLEEYDLHTGNRGADSVIATPEKWIDSKYFPFYASAAAMLIESRARMDTKTTSRTISAAIGRIIKNSRRNDMQGLFSHNNRFIACDGYRLIRLNSDISSLPHVQNDFDVAYVMENLKDYGEKLHLPTVAELKAFIAKDKSIQGRTKHKKYGPSPYLLDNYIYCNPVYLIDMLLALPDCIAYKPETATKPIYFSAENGDGVLLPVNPAKNAQKAA